MKLYFSCSHASNTAGVYPSRLHGAASAPISRRPAACRCRHTHIACRHDTGDPRAYYMSKYTRERARYTFTAAAHTPHSSAVCPATSCSLAALSTAASRSVAPPLASPPRCCRRRERPHGCRRCRRCRRAAWLCAYHGRYRRQGTCESRTGDSDSRPTPLPVSAAVADASREQRAGRRARRVGGVPTSAAGGVRAQMPWRMVRDASPSSRIDYPAHAWAVRGAEMTGSEHHDKAKQDRVTKRRKSESMRERQVEKERTKRVSTKWRTAWRCRAAGPSRGRNEEASHAQENRSKNSGQMKIRGKECVET
jgi:hypothetical protein